MWERKVSVSGGISLLNGVDVRGGVSVGSPVLPKKKENIPDTVDAVLFMFQSLVGACSSSCVSGSHSGQDFACRRLLVSNLEKVFVCFHI